MPSRGVVSQHCVHCKTVTDEDKTGRHGGWANKISITTLIVFVAGAAGALVEARFTRKAVDDLSTTLKEVVREQKEFNTTIDSRQTTDEIWRAAYDAAKKERDERKRK